MDIQQENQRHLEGWQSFTKLMLWSCVGTGAILILMALFLV